jgi:hypothetical protein
MPQTQLRYEVPGALAKIAALQTRLLQSPDDMERFAVNPAEQLTELGILATADLAVSPGYRCLARAMRQPSFRKWLADYRHEPSEDEGVRRARMLTSLQQAVIEAAGITPRNPLTADSVARHHLYNVMVVVEIELSVSMVVNTVVNSDFTGIDVKAPARRGGSPTDAGFSARDAEIVADTLGRFA